MKWFGKKKAEELEQPKLPSLLKRMSQWKRVGEQFTYLGISCTVTKLGEYDPYDHYEYASLGFTYVDLVGVIHRGEINSYTELELILEANT